LLSAVRDLPDIEVRSLYDLYPDFDIDIAAEQAALLRAELVVWLHPMYWYSAPAMLKHWFDVVLAHGWAYGDGGTALAGKSCLWVPTTGGDAAEYSAEGIHQQPFEHFIAPIEQTARFCAMVWETPLIVQGAHRISDAELAGAAAAFRARLTDWATAHNAVIES
jgi:glutathione-regulated potassium-efflux system ancillary protein KefF